MEKCFLVFKEPALSNPSVKEKIHDVLRNLLKTHPEYIIDYTFEPGFVIIYAFIDPPAAFEFAQTLQLAVDNVQIKELSDKIVSI